MEKDDTNVQAKMSITFEPKNVEELTGFLNLAWIHIMKRSLF